MASNHLPKITDICTYLAQVNLLMHSGHDGMISRTGLHGDVLSKCSSEANEGFLPAIKASNPPRVDGSQLASGNTITWVRVVVVNGF